MSLALEVNNTMEDSMETHVAWIISFSSFVIAASLSFIAVFFSVKLSQIAKRLKEISKK